MLAYLGYRKIKQCLGNISNTKDRALSLYTSGSGYFLSNFEVLGNVVKHCLECIIYMYVFSIELKLRRNREIKS